MPSNPKLFVHNHVYEICFRTISGLPLTSSKYMRRILLGIMARAQELYPVQLGDIIVMSNHIHMFIRVYNPNDVDQFIRYFKTESALAINALRGCTKGPVWEDGYDSPIVDSVADLILRSSYIYSNPQKAGLTTTIEEYPNFSSWDAFHTAQGEKTLAAARIVRKHVTALKDESPRGQARYLSKLKKKMGHKRLKLIVSPKLIFEAFLQETELSFEEYRQRVLQKVRVEERYFAKERARKGKSVLGAAALRLQSIFQEHTPKKYGKKMLVLCGDIRRRKELIYTIKQLIAEAREVGRLRREGHLIPYPPGFFPPGGRQLASLLPSAL